MKIVNGRYEFKSDYTWMNNTMEDGYIETDCLWLDGSTSQGYGLIFRLTDAENFYFLWITGEGSYTVGKVVNDHALPIKGWTASEAIQKQGENHLKVEFCGPLVNIFINRANFKTKKF